MYPLKTYKFLGFLFLFGYISIDAQPLPLEQVSNPMSEFLSFAEEKQGHRNNEHLLKELHRLFLENLTPQEHPVIIAMGGSPGSGKTTFRKSLNLANVHLHDMDEVMVSLPEYQEDLRQIGPKKAFEKWWPHAQSLARILVQFAIQARYSIIYDRTCGTEGSYFDLLQAKKLGYRICLHGFFVDRNVAWERLQKREKEEGRAVTEEILDEYRSRFSALWPYYVSLVDEAVLYDTNEKNPRIIFSSKEGIVDPTLYQGFLLAGDSFTEYFQSKLRS